MLTEAGSRIQAHLRLIYGERAETILPQVERVLEGYRDRLCDRGGERWTEQDVTLITYGDQVCESGRPSLATLRRFLVENRLSGVLPIVHILPFCPYSSDDGFSVIDFRAIDPQLGDWEDLGALGEEVDLMYDLVLNHVSQQSQWFQDYLGGGTEHAQWFHELDPGLDLSQVTRPRSHPLLTAFQTERGERHIWTTFSADQIDLNYSEPAVLLEMLDILLMYVANGARVIRLDAIAFLWKTVGTSCLHLPETHEVVKLFRSVLDEVAPWVILLTETNVPHKENVSYFGEGDEAHMVYNFSLPPLLFDAYLNQEATPLKRWLASLEPPVPGTTWFNFTASHDGIGVRPLEGLVDDERFERLVKATRERGGEVSMRQLPGGGLSPYELNVTWRDAMRVPGGDDPLLVQRVLASQAFMLAVQGVPAVYFHSLVGTPNDLEGMRESGHARRINRRKYEFDELCDLIDHDPIQSAIFNGYRSLLAVRRQQSAFHPDGGQRVLESVQPEVVAFERTSVDGSQKIRVIANVSNGPVVLDSSLTEGLHGVRDLLGADPEAVARGELAACQILWLTGE